MKDHAAPDLSIPVRVRQDVQMPGGPPRTETHITVMEILQTEDLITADKLHAVAQICVNL